MKPEKGTRKSLITCYMTNPWIRWPLDIVRSQGCVASWSGDPIILNHPFNTYYQGVPYGLYLLLIPCRPYGPYPLLSVNPLRPVCPVNPAQPTKSDFQMTRGSRTARAIDESSSESLNTSVCPSHNPWPLWKRNTILSEKKKYRSLLRDPCRIQKQVAVKNVTCFLRVLSCIYLFSGKKNGQVGRSPSVVRSDSVRSPEPEDEDVRREKEKLLNRNETSIEESSFSVIIKASLGAKEPHVRLANHMTIVPLLVRGLKIWVRLRERVREHIVFNCSLQVFALSHHIPISWHELPTLPENQHGEPGL